MKFLYIFIIILLAVGCGTDQGEGRKFTYSVINETDKDIVIRAYKSDNTDSPKLTNILAGDRIVKTYQSSSPDPAQGDLYNYLIFFGGDSITVTFNSERLLSFNFVQCSNDFKNPLNVCEYSDTDEVFIFTEQDFENAQPCDGNCE